MSYGSGFTGYGVTKHKVFLSYYHQDDQVQKFVFQRDFGHLFVPKSVSIGDIDSDLSTEYIKRLIREGYIMDSSVLMVLVGPKTRCRKHVDWEISAALSKQAGGYCGLLGILLPSFPLMDNGNYRYDQVPPRLADNVAAGYANIYTWAWLTQMDSRVTHAIQEAFDRRVSHTHCIDNSRTQMQRNLAD